VFVVEGFDFLCDGEVLVGDSPVRDSGIDHRHLQCLVSEQCGDRLEAHAPIDGLRRECVPQLMRVDMADSRCGSSGLDCLVDSGTWDRATAISEEQWTVLPVRSPLEPCVDHCFELGMQGDVPVVVKLADRDAEPVGGSDLDDRIDCQVEEFTFAHAGP
jgi:hypothetical protein